MDLLVTHFNALTTLFAGALCVIVGVYFWVKEGDPLFGIIVCFGFGANLIAYGFLDLTKLTIPGWVNPSVEAVGGIGVIAISISKLYAVPSPNPGRRTWWWILAFGIGGVFLAIYHALQYYWR